MGPWPRRGPYGRKVDVSWRSLVKSLQPTAPRRGTGTSNWVDGRFDATPQCLQARALCLAARGASPRPRQGSPGTTGRRAQGQAREVFRSNRRVRGSYRVVPAEARQAPGENAVSSYSSFASPAGVTASRTSSAHTASSPPMLENGTVWGSIPRRPTAQCRRPGGRP